jgi:predicted MFS family arabinose efflux permease
MNAEGVLVERLYGRSVMSSFHGFWSVGVLLGAAVSALSSRAAIDARVQFAVEAVVLAVIAAAAARLLLNDPTSRESEAPPRFAPPTRPVLLIGLVGLCAVFGEQAGTDWSALYLRRELGGTASVAALAVSAFAVTMAVARLVGDRVIRRIGPVASVRLSGLCAAAGSMTVVLAPDLAAGLAGFALLGVGVALVIPIVFAAAGRIGPHAGQSIAGVAGVAYASGLAAPAVIGGVAAISSLTASFCLVAGLVALMAVGAGVVRGPTRTASKT